VCCSVCACVYCLLMGWLRFVGSLKSYVSFTEYRFFYRALLQKRPMILRSLLIVATPYLLMWPPRLGTKGADLQEMSSTNLRQIIWVSACMLLALHRSHSIAQRSVCSSVLLWIAVWCSTSQCVAVTFTL